jgi:hypothetical protein
MHEVKSSVISHIDYNPETNELTVRFHSGHNYSYSGVTSAEFEALLNSPSVGKHFSEHIRPKKKGIILART